MFSFICHLLTCVHEYSICCIGYTANSHTACRKIAVFRVVDQYGIHFQNYWYVITRHSKRLAYWLNRGNWNYLQLSCTRQTGIPSSIETRLIRRGTNCEEYGSFMMFVWGVTISTKFTTLLVVLPVACKSSWHVKCMPSIADLRQMTAYGSVYFHDQRHVMWHDMWEWSSVNAYCTREHAWSRTMQRVKLTTNKTAPVIQRN